MKISFCTTCMGRTHHLKETLPKNIHDNIFSGSGPDVEFIVLDYNSDDGLQEWILGDPELRPFLESGMLKYFRTEEPEYFRMAHAKNMSHRLASGDVLCNLDADNFLGLGFASYLDRVFSKNPDTVLNPSIRVSKLFKPDERGFFGRIAISRENFERLHGYDETFRGWGLEDTDFMYRAKGLGLKHLRIDELRFLSIITHGNRERAEHMVPAEEVEQEVDRIESLKNSDSLYQKFARKVEVLARPIQINDGGHFGEGTVFDRNGRETELGPMPSQENLSFNRCARGLPELLRGRLAPQTRIALASSYGLDFDQHALPH